MKPSQKSIRTALVTGASRGIGRAVAEELRCRGDVVLTPTRKELDLADPAAVLSWAQKCPEPVDILVNNAGENPIGPLADVGLETWERILAVNLTGPTILMQHLGRGMVSRGWGRIVNISSCYSLVTRSGRAPYGATKAALNSLTRSAAIEFGRHGVLVNAVLPGFVETEMTHRNNTPDQLEALVSQVPLGRLAQPLEIAKFVAFLTSAANTYIAGQTLVIDGGFMLQ